jgi:predicted acylesterase/phospholipase RssA
MSKPHLPLGKIGFVLTGGSFRGAFEVGALKAFDEQRLIPSYIVGVSAGALNAATFAAGRLDGLIKIYEDVAKQPKIVYKLSFINLIKAFFWSKSLLINSPLEKIIISKRIGLQEFIASAIKVDIVTTNFQTGEREIFSNKNPEHQKSYILKKALLASAAMPVIFPPVFLDGKQLLDGGVAETVPVNLAIQNDCDTIFVILTDPHHSIRTDKVFHNVFDIAKRAANITMWKNLNNDLKRCFEINNDILNYKKLANEVFDLISQELKEVDTRRNLQLRLTEIFASKNFSFQDKRAVNIILIEPDEESSSDRLFDYKSIPFYLQAGYEKTITVLRKLNFI